MALACTGLDVATQHSLLGKRALLISSATSTEPSRVLGLADVVLASGASVTLLVPLPRSGAASEDDGALKLLLRIQRMGFPRLMAALGFSWGTAGQYGTGNRQRLTFCQIRADDVEALNMALSDADLLLLQTASETPGCVSDGNASVDVDGAGAASAAVTMPLGERRARFAMLRATYSFVLRRLQRFDQPLVRDSHGGGVRWAWLGASPAGE